MTSVFVAVESLAITSPGKSLQLDSVGSDLNCTRYLVPGIAFQVITMLSSEASISPMIGGETITIVNSWTSLRPGAPSSVTRTVTKFVLGTCSVVGVQVNRPLV